MTPLSVLGLMNIIVTSVKCYWNHQLKPVLQQSFEDLRRFLSEDPSSPSSSVYFQMPKNLRSFEDFKPKVTKIFWENLTILCTKLSEKVKKYVLFLNF